MARLQRMSNENHMSVFDSLNVDHVPLDKRSPEIKKKAQKQRDDSWQENRAAAKLSHNNIDEIDIYRKDKSIRSARCGTDGISHDKSAESGFGTAGRNTISDSETLDRISESRSNKELTTEEKRDTAEARRQKEAEWRQSHSHLPGETDEDFMKRRNIPIGNASVGSNKKQWVPSGKISMFDEQDFQRVADDHSADKFKTPKLKDDSWKQVRKAETTRDRQNGLIDGLSSSSDNSSYQNMHKNATDRMFNILNQKDK